MYSLNPFLWTLSSGKRQEVSHAWASPGEVVTWPCICHWGHLSIHTGWFQSTHGLFIWVESMLQGEFSSKAFSTSTPLWNKPWWAWLSGFADAGAWKVSAEVSGYTFDSAASHFNMWGLACCHCSQLWVPRWKSESLLQTWLSLWNSGAIHY